MYKLMAIDIDDTLLNDKLQITPGTRQAIAAAMEQGVTVTLATGRMYASARKIAGQIALNVPLITYQGALVKNLTEVWYERYVPSEAAEKIYRYAVEHQLHLHVFWNDQVYTPEDNEKVRAYTRLADVPYTVEPRFSTLLDKPFPKMIMIDLPQKLDEVAAELKPLLGDEVHITKSKPHYLEFTHREGTKGHALRHVAEMLHCDMSQVIAVGDSWNDRDMIEAAGLGVAMGNAVDQLKELADYVTFSNNEDGVRHVIEKFILKRVI